MSRVHDMGGRYGDGPIPGKDDADVFHSEWEAHALALNLACGALGAWNIDASRHARECLSPKDYASFSYYEKWVSGLTDLMVARNLITPDELSRVSAGVVTSALPASVDKLDPRALLVENVETAIHTHAPYSRTEGPEAKFQTGDVVLTISHNQNHSVRGGHTRLPAYATGRKGIIERRHGNHVFPDSNAHYLGQAPEPLYAVRFTARELWGVDVEHDGDDMVLDLWQSYLREPSA